jgi:hypothetical protein
LLHERGLDLLIADAAIASAEGDVTTAGAIQNPNISGGLYRSFFSGHLYESHLGWFVGVGNSNGIEDVLSGKRGLRQEVAHQALSAARRRAARYLDAYRTYIATNVEYIQDLAWTDSPRHTLVGGNRLGRSPISRCADSSRQRSRRDADEHISPRLCGSATAASMGDPVTFEADQCDRISKGDWQPSLTSSPSV